MSEDALALCRRCRHINRDHEMLFCKATNLFCSTARYTACDEGQFFEPKPNILTRLAEAVGLA